LEPHLKEAQRFDGKFVLQSNTLTAEDMALGSKESLNKS